MVVQYYFSPFYYYGLVSSSVAKVIEFSNRTINFNGNKVSSQIIILIYN
ncbi:protein of unknown function [Candidatus Nitrosocosmicus franklandus]|uniref:Uncharacterized protein n=1 Tax=Candidatus Nitrosocosmicus franklandianus TaxID=1798806 RepID=A0A484IAQ4_9ARCH|nr:protein of unknown function [Candidatus Nitrosocosmicus franklandus]